MNTEHRKPLDLDGVELVRLFGYTVTIDQADLDAPTPHFHKFGPDRPHPNAGSIDLPVVHAARFAVPCDECYPVTDA